jgi:predicted ribosomally synthesized six-cysteine peptide SCIFF
MTHIKTIFTGNVNEQDEHIGCGECQTSCQSACKTSCTIANQICEHE